jgi:hypothetical protein
MSLEEHFAPFLARFVADPGAIGPDPDWVEQDTRRLVGFRPRLYTEFISQLARNSYNQGVVRFLLPQTLPSLLNWNTPSGWQQDWVQWKDRLVVFAYDWLGRQIAFDNRRLRDGEPSVAILEPGTGQLLEVPQTFAGFITMELVRYHDAALALQLHEQWLSTGGRVPRMSECVGYKVPLFLSGPDSVSNLEIVDLAVYVSICGQLAQQTRHLPPGTRIKVSGEKRFRS